ncbi:MAG: OmpH family outer membrane protein [Bryobacteraceae bacterium]
MSCSSLSRPVLLCAIALTATGIASAQAKVAIINLQRAVLETSEIKKAQKDLEAKFKPRADALEKLQRELNDLQSQLQSSSGKLSPQGELELQGRAAKKQREARNLSEDLQADVDRERNEVLQRAGLRMTGVIKKVAEEKGVDMVVDVNTTLYFKPAMEVTNEVIAAFDKAFPVK